MFRRFEPSSGGNLLEFSSGRLRPGQNSNGSDSNFGSFGDVVNDGKKDRSDMDGFEHGSFLETVDSQGPDHGRVFFLGDDLAQDLDGPTNYNINLCSLCVCVTT